MNALYENTANTLDISICNHAGTHIDVPKHFFNSGKSLSDYPASFWFFQKHNSLM